MKTPLVNSKAKPPGSSRRFSSSSTRARRKRSGFEGVNVPGPDEEVAPPLWAGSPDTESDANHTPVFAFVDGLCVI